MREALNGIGIEVEERTGRAIALPVSAHDVAAIVKLARERGAVVTPHFAGPPGDAAREPVYVSLERFASISEIVPEDLMAVVDAGVTVGLLEERLAEGDFYWPGSHGASSDEMVGDIVARAPGNWTLAGNIVRRYLLGADAVLADGAFLTTGGRTVKSVTGYDLKQIFVGSWGTLGVITSLILRLEAEANRESVSERYRRDFPEGEGDVPPPGREPDAAGTTPAAPTATTSAGNVILRRLKNEFDPDGVFPSLQIIGAGAEPADARRG